MKKLILILLFLVLAGYADATVPNATPLFNQYSCNSSTTQFPYAFPITAASDMTVYITDNMGNITQQSATFSVDTTNVWVNYPLVGSPCPTGYTITLVPSTPQTQTTTYGNRTPFTATAVGASFDKLTLIAQQLQGQVNRALLLPVSQSGQTFPSPNAGYLIGWNGAGQLANINNPAAVAQWILTGANISYTLGNVSTTGTMTATGGFIGALTGNVTGNVVGNLTGNVTGNASGTAATVTTAAQPAITSVGTLTGLISSGNVGIGSANPGVSLDVVGGARSTVGFNGPYMKFSNTQTSGTGGGTATSGSWLVAPINTKDSDTQSIASLCTGNGAPVATCTAANQFVLPAGTYQIEGIQKYYETSNSQARLYNVTGSAILVNGTNTVVNNADANEEGVSEIFGQFTLSGLTAISLQYQVAATKASNGLGAANSYGSEVYAIVSLNKVS